VNRRLALLAELQHGHRRDDDIALLALRSPVAAPDLFLMKVGAAPDAVGRVRERLRAWLDDLSHDADDQLGRGFGEPSFGRHVGDAHVPPRNTR
jgi:hypothetical protein